jgi:hypothetical protein
MSTVDELRRALTALGGERREVRARREMTTRRRRRRTTRTARERRRRPTD